MPVLRVLQGPAVAQPAGHARTSSPSRTSRAGCSRPSPTGATEVCLQGGIHPDFDGDYYIDVARAVHEVAPGDPHPRLHRPRGHRGRQAPRRAAGRLPAPAHGRRAARPCPAPPPRSSTTRSAQLLCPDKINTEEWLEAHRTAHSVGLRSNVTIMFGAVEQPRSWARHLVRTRALQKETGGFTEFVPLPFVHMAAPIYLQHKARRGPDLPRGAAHARRRPHRLPRLDRQHPGVVGEARPRRRRPGPPGRRQRPRRHPDGREHLPGRRRLATAR